MTLEEMIQQLPPDLKREVTHYVAYLLEKQKQGADTPLSQEWAGGLSQFRDAYTALELQKKALEWRK